MARRVRKWRQESFHFYSAASCTALGSRFPLGEHAPEKNEIGRPDVGLISSIRAVQSLNMWPTLPASHKIIPDTIFWALAVISMWRPDDIDGGTLWPVMAVRTFRIASGRRRRGCRARDSSMRTDCITRNPGGTRGGTTAPASSPASASVQASAMALTLRTAGNAWEIIPDTILYPIAPRHQDDLYLQPGEKFACIAFDNLTIDNSSANPVPLARGAGLSHSTLSISDNLWRTRSE